MNKKTDHKLFPGPVLRKDDGHLRGQAGHQEVLQLARLGILLRVHQEARRHPGGIRIAFPCFVQQILISLIYQRNKLVNFQVHQSGNIELQNLIYSQESYNFMKSFPL